MNKLIYIMSKIFFDLNMHVGSSTDIHLSIPIGAGSWSGTMIVIKFTESNYRPCQNIDILKTIIRYYSPDILVIKCNDIQYKWLYELMEFSKHVKIDRVNTNEEIELKILKHKNEC